MESYNIEGYKDLARDPHTGTIVNVNSLDYQHYIASRNAKNLKNERVESMEEDLANLKGEIGEIKSLLKELVNGKYKFNI